MPWRKVAAGQRLQPVEQAPAAQNVAGDAWFALYEKEKDPKLKERFRARAVAVVGAEQPAEARRGLTAYLARRPRVARSVGVEAASGVVLVRADLVPIPDEAA